MSADPAVLAALAAAAIGLAVLFHVLEPPQSIRAGRGQAVLVLWPDGPGRAVRALARETPEEFAFDTRPQSGARPIVLAQGTAAGRALRLAAKGKARAVVLVAPRARPRADLFESLLPPVVVVDRAQARVAALLSSLPGAELITAPDLGARQTRRPDLIAQALRRAASMAEASAIGRQTLQSTAPQA